MNAKPQVLFVHTNYPAQFRFLVKEFLARGWDVWFASHTYKHPPLPDVHCIKLDKSIEQGSKLDQSQQTSLLAFENLLKAKRQSGLRPIFTYVHTGWGLGQFVKDLFPATKLIAYSEWWFNLNAEDFRFDPKNLEVKHTQRSRLQMVLRNQPFALELQQADLIVSPTEWQKAQLPKLFRDRCHVIFDGIDTNMFSPGSYDTVCNNDFDAIVENKPLLTYATRGLEPYRGFPEFIRAVEELLKEDADWHVAIAGEDKANYHRKPKSPQLTYGRLAKERLDELGFGNRVHFLGSLPMTNYRNLLRRSNLHCYFTRPFVLSWSLLESALVGCELLSSITQPVQEFLKDDSGSTLVDHTSLNLGEDLVNAAMNCRDNDLESGNKRRTDRESIRKFACKNKCTSRHLNLIGLDK